MSEFAIIAVGAVAQILFSSRLILQWIVSEKNKRVLTPSLFWKLSLLASFLLFVYGYLQNDFSIMLGQSLTYFIYIRNLQLQGEWQKSPLLMRWFLLTFPIMIVMYYYNNGEYDINNLFDSDNIATWLLVMGSVAQVIFTLRFVYQWLYSEKHKTSSLPFGFWLLSLIGSLMILTYGFIRTDYILIAGHLMGSIIYTRNIIILKKQT
ncbi:MAG: lipid-A-disaccharide synthase N-terminal domain-containing protein [Flavobacteriaceae bacterium]|nr:lipid-A-disaccharide synthase N-terminal domain-containing protein [Flavobacteriaceae bacterium]